MPEHVWTNNRFDPPLDTEFHAALAPRQVIHAPDAVNNYLSPAQPDPRLAADCEIAFGQPDPDDLIASPKIRFVQLTTAGYTRYDREDFRKAMKNRGVPVCNASSVYAEPCAQHALAFMLAAARRLPEAVDAQVTVRMKAIAQSFRRSKRDPTVSTDEPANRDHWAALKLRQASQLLGPGTNVLIVGYGAIARRLVELLAPFGLSIRAFRRTVRGDENCPTSPIDSLATSLPTADVVMNILPLGDSTRRFFDAERFDRMKPGVRFYNIGRGDTVDQPALIKALVSGQVAQAYLDVTSPEPLPTDHPLWLAPNCHITPHTAGGWDAETPAQIAHFLANLRRFDQGEPLVDRIM